MRRINILLILGVIVLTACMKTNIDSVDKSEHKEISQPEKNEFHDESLDDNRNTIVATMGDIVIDKEDIQYELFRMKVLQDIQGENENSPDRLTNEIALNEQLRLEAIRLIANEKGIVVHESEKEKRIHQLQESLNEFTEFKEKVIEYGEKTFWAQEKERYNTIIKSEKLIKALMEEQKEKHPNFEERALKFEAMKKLQKLIEEKVKKMDIQLADL